MILPLRGILGALGRDEGDELGLGVPGEENPDVLPGLGGEGSARGRARVRASRRSWSQVTGRV